MSIRFLDELFHTVREVSVGLRELLNFDVRERSVVVAEINSLNADIFHEVETHIARFRLSDL